MNGNATLAFGKEWSTIGEFHWVSSPLEFLPRYAGAIKNENFSFSKINGKRIGLPKSGSSVIRLLVELDLARVSRWV